MAGFGSRELTLALLHRMKDINAPRVEDALHEMGATRADLREAHTMWMKWAFSKTAPKGLKAFRAALGPPVFTGPKAFGDLTCQVAHWKLWLWPDLLFEVLTGPDGDLWNQWFIRPGEPLVIPFDELEPWSAVIADVGAGFEDAENVEGSAPHHWAVDFSHEGKAYRARFIYGLLQSVDPR